VVKSITTVKHLVDGLDLDQKVKFKLVFENKIMWADKILV